ncbi:hypothetical protein ACFYVL_41950 [Streptomyces sp. NPDC004111]|uniref:hypothetical protein n=1 Tax=Streptomyces sp. NPDC004111 TaxID=3364690 RepID=UPI0036A8173E
MPSRRDRLPFPVPTSTTDTPSRDSGWHQRTVYWSDKANSLEGAFSSLSVNAAADGADEVLGARAEWAGGSSYVAGWFAYGTAIWYQDNG